MKITGLDGKIYSWNLTNHVPLNSDTRPRSSLHKLAKQFIKECWPCCRIIEEIYIPGSGGLYADFFIPLMTIMIEVHGPQHYTFNNYFHKNILDFAEAKQRDKNKAEWCMLNNIELIILPFDKQNKWKEILRGTTK